MGEFLNKLSSYYLLNYLLPGVVFSVAVTYLTNYDLVYDDLVIGFFIFYFVGLVISRVGSLVLEPLFRKIGFVDFSNYKEYSNAVKSDDSLETLSEVNNMYRTLASGFLVVLILVGLENLPQCLTLSREDSLLAVIVVLFILFSFSYRKQSNYINKKVTLR